MSYNPPQISSYGSIEQPRVLPTEVINRSSIPGSPCTGKTTKGNIAHPTDITKYVACLNEISYEIMDCPNGLIYNAPLDQCEKIKNPQSICERDQPCMNEGQCYQTSPTSYKCTCRGAWTGERCETPLSTCATDPCGQGNTCSTLKTSDFKQDFVCVCDGQNSYGLTCDRNTVPNPCLAAASEREQYYPFAFSAQAYVQCNGDILYVRPCPDGLYWSQDAKTCDRMEKPSTPTLARDQSTSYQVTYGTETPSTFTRPIASFGDQSSSSYGQQDNQILPRKLQPAFNYAFNSPSTLRLLHRTKQQPFIQTNNYGTVQEEQQQQPIITKNTYGSVQEEQKPFIPRNNYGSTQEEQPRSTWSMPPSVIIDRNQQTPQYGQAYNPQPQSSFVLQQRLRPITRVIQPEPTRITSSGYRR
jgi:hypothetical protein